MRDKTNAMRKLDSMKIAYNEYDYTDTGAVSGVDVAGILGYQVELSLESLGKVIKFDTGDIIKEREL